MLVATALLQLTYVASRLAAPRMALAEPAIAPARAPARTAPLCMQVPAEQTSTEEIAGVVVPAVGSAASDALKGKLPTACKLHSLDVGSRLPSDETPLVILHGLFGAGNNFQSWAKRLAAEDSATRRIVLADLRNHGDSAHAPSMSYHEMAADVVALLDELEIEKAVLCGHSLGGKVAMATALLHSPRVERLLVLDMAPVTYGADDGSGWGEINEVVAALNGLDLSQVSSKREADRLLSKSIPNADIRAFALTNLVKGSSGTFRWRINLPAIEASLPELATWGDGLDGRTFGGNTLFVGGGKSRYVRSTHLPAISQHFSRFSLTTIRSAAHWIHADEPEALLTVACSFLDAPL